MKMDKKVTDFIKLEEGNIGRKAAVVTGAVLASTVLGAILTSPAEAGLHCDWQAHGNYWYHAGAQSIHHNAYDGSHTDGPC